MTKTTDNTYIGKEDEASVDLADLQNPSFESFYVPSLYFQFQDRLLDVELYEVGC